MTDIKKIVQSPVFAKQKKKLHKQQIKDLDAAVKYIFNTPASGDMKVGDLQDIQVYKFKSSNQQILLAYEIIDSTLFLYTFGSHENFYRDLKNICNINFQHSQVCFDSVHVHLSLGGLLRQTNRLLEEPETLWDDVDSATGELWERDKKVMGIAESARKTRLSTTWRKYDSA